MSIIALFCKIDDFFLAYEKWMASQSSKPLILSQLSLIVLTLYVGQAKYNSSPSLRTL